MIDVPIERGYLPSTETSQILTPDQNRTLAEKRFTYWSNTKRSGSDKLVSDMATFWRDALDQKIHPGFVQDDYDIYDWILNYADMHIIKMFGNIDDYKAWIHPKSIIGTCEDTDSEKIACMAYTLDDVDRIADDWAQRGYKCVASEPMHNFFGVPTSLWYLVTAIRY